LELDEDNKAPGDEAERFKSEHFCGAWEDTNPSPAADRIRVAEMDICEPSSTSMRLE
jgi:hypothetical protein